MFQLINDFVSGTVKDRVISQHRTLENAVKANRKLQRQVKARNGATSYIPTSYRNNWELIDPEELDRVLCRLER